MTQQPGNKSKQQIAKSMFMLYRGLSRLHKKPGMASYSYRPVSIIPLRPGFLSLGLPQTAFAPEASTGHRAFDAAISGGVEHPDTVWFFRGSNFYTFDVKQGKLTAGPSPMSQFNGVKFPASFDYLDAATWGGPDYPTLSYYFRDQFFLDVRRPGQASLIAGGAWGIDSSSPFAQGIDAALHGIGTQYSGCIHFFKGNLYCRHRLSTGKIEAGPCPITDIFPGMPEPFLSGIDNAFYGSGDFESSVIYFVKRDQCLRYDLRADYSSGGAKPQVSQLDAQFPPLASFMPRPQLFLIEDYELQNFEGDLQHGDAVEDAIFVAAGSKQTVAMTVTKKDSSSSTVDQQILRVRNDSTLSKFYDEAKKENRSENSSEDYRYGLDASFHGDASLDSPWSPEVNAQGSVRGSTSDIRSNFAKAAFGTVQHQSEQAAQDVNQTVQSASTSVTSSTETVWSQERVLDRTTQTTNATYQAFAELAPYLLLLVLKGVKVGFLDGNGTADIVPLSEMNDLLSRRLPVADGSHSREEVQKWIIKQLQNVEDYSGQAQTVITDPDSSGSIRFKPALQSSYQATFSDGSNQTIPITGLITSAATLLLPNLTLTMAEVPSGT